MTDCADPLLLHGLVDGELDAANARAVEEHLKSCGPCAEEVRRLMLLKRRLASAPVRYEAPEALRDSIGRMLGSAPPPAPISERRRPALRFAVPGAITALAACLALLLIAPMLANRGIEDELVAAHVRSLLANHLTDVQTSNQHVVKPWFNGRIDFAPPVPDLAAKGFPLIGGRLDYIDGHVVPALVYGRRLHRINLFIWRADKALPPLFVTGRGDYSIVRWSANGLVFWAVSDLGHNELELFRRTYGDETGA